MSEIATTKMMRTTRKAIAGARCAKCPAPPRQCAMAAAKVSTSVMSPAEVSDAVATEMAASEVPRPPK